MPSNIRISIVAITVLIITFSVLVIVEKILDPNLRNPLSSSSIVEGKNYFLTSNEFFDTDFSNQRTIFLVGSSHVGQINVTQVNYLVNSENPVIIYNLAIGADHPSNRLKDIDKIISANPEIIFYGISHRDFLFPYQTTFNPFLLDIHQIISCTLYSNLGNLVPSNPQLLIRDSLSKILKIPPKKQLTESFSVPNTPFYSYDIKPTISNDTNLKNDKFHALTWDNDNMTYQNICAVNKIINKLHENEIKIIFFTIPLHGYYLESFSDSQKNGFSKLKNELIKKYGLKIYEFEEKYVGLNVWKDAQHISHHKNVTVFNNDVANIIIENIEK